MVDHFIYEAQFVVGITPIGRTTLSLLEMNDPMRRRIRELMATIQNERGAKLRATVEWTRRPLRRRYTPVRERALIENPPD